VSSRKLIARAIRSRVISMPSWNLRAQPQEYQDEELAAPGDGAVAVEQASTFGWERYMADRAACRHENLSARRPPLKELQRKFGFAGSSGCGGGGAVGGRA